MKFHRLLALSSALLAFSFALLAATGRAASASKDTTLSGNTTITGPVTASGNVTVSTSGGSLKWSPTTSDSNLPAIYLENQSGADITAYKATGVSTYYATRITTSDVIGTGVSGFKFYAATAPTAIGSHTFVEVLRLYSGAAFVNGTLTVGSAGTAIVAVKSTSTTWDPGSLANGATTETTVAGFTGLAAGDPAVASLSTLTNAAWQISAHVVNSTTVHVTLTNATGGTVDLASGTLRVMVHQF